MYAIDRATRRRLVPLVVAALCAAAAAPLAAQDYRYRAQAQAAQAPQPTPVRACFLLSELGGGELRRRPADGCDRQVSPAATFELAAAVAGLDASVVRANSVSNGQTLDSALASSNPGYFRDIDQQMGSVRMANTSAASATATPTPAAAASTGTAVRCGSRRASR